MKDRIRRPLLALGPLLTLGACLPIPHRHTSRAGAQFHVTDQQARPIIAATVAVYEGSIIGGTLRRVATARTDANGLATIKRERAWHWLVILIPDAEAPSVFGWCVESPSFTALGRPMEDERSQVLDVALMPTATATPCPERLDRLKLEHGQFVMPASHEFQ